MQLRIDPPQVEEAQVHLRQAAQEFEWCSAGPVEVGRNDLAQARAYFLSWRGRGRTEMSGRVHDATHEHAPIVAADAKALEGQIVRGHG